MSPARLEREKQKRSGVVKSVEKKKSVDNYVAG
jgi:hypothetical protein